MRHLRLLFSGVIAVWIVVSIVSSPPQIDSLWRLVTLLTISWIAIAFHEVGHLVFGRIVRFRALMFACGPLLVLREKNGFRPKWNPSPILWLGAAASGPTAASEHIDLAKLRKRMSVYTAGGPLMSLIVGASALLILSSFAILPSAASHFGTFAAISIGIGLLTLLPFLPNSDGSRLVQLARSNAESDREVANMALTAFGLGGQSPRYWPVRLVRAAVGEEDGSSAEMFGRLAAVQHFMDAEKIDTARLHLARVMEHADVLPEAMRPSVFLEAAYVAARYEGDPTIARKHLAEAGASKIFACHRSLAEAAIAMCDGHEGQALALIATAEEQCSSMFGSEARMLEDRIELLRVACATSSASEWQS